MIKRMILIASSTLFLGCSYSIKDVDVQGKNEECVNKCVRIHTQSIKDTSETESKSDILRAAKYSYEICVSTCK